MFRGWKVVGVAFGVAMFGWGLGFYGVGVFIAQLQALHGWSASTVSAAVTTYYLLGGSLILFVGMAFERWSAATVVLTGMAAMLTGTLGLTLVTATWHLYLAVPFMAVGWACTSGAAINLILAPWFERKRGQAVSAAFNGASFGGIVVAPALLFAIDHWGYPVGVALVAGLMAAALIPLVLGYLWSGPAALGLGPDGDPVATAAAGGKAGLPTSRWSFLRDGLFWTVSAPFALALMAQVGFITHQVSYLKPHLAAAAIGWAVSATTLGAVAGRLVVGTFVDRVNRRAVAAGNFFMQAIGIGLLIPGDGTALLFAGCILFGLGVGNTTSLPSLIVQKEYSRAQFGAVVGALIAVNQFTYALGPSILGWLRDWRGGYDMALTVCALLYCAAGIGILSGPWLLARPAAPAALERP